jgi:hypothetical protein
MTGLWILGAIVALAVGVWIGVGAPGIRHKPSTERRHTSHRNLNPIAWGRTSNRERQRVRDRDDRKPRLRRR